MSISKLKKSFIACSFFVLRNPCNMSTTLSPPHFIECLCTSDTNWYQLTMWTINNDSAFDHGTLGFYFDLFCFVYDAETLRKSWYMRFGDIKWMPCIKSLWVSVNLPKKSVVGFVFIWFIVYNMKSLSHVCLFNCCPTVQHWTHNKIVWLAKIRCWCLVL